MPQALFARIEPQKSSHFQVGLTYIPSFQEDI